MNDYLKVRCPHCKAAEGSPCVIPMTRYVLRFSDAHPSRIEAAGGVADYATTIKTYRAAEKDSREAKLAPQYNHPGTTQTQASVDDSPQSGDAGAGR